MSDSPNFPLLTRRELLRTGGVAIAGSFLTSAFRPLNVWAKGKAESLATAKKVIFIFLDGGLSQMDSFDAKEGRWTPPEFDIRSYTNDIKLPYGLFKNLPDVLDKVAVVRSLNAWDAVHGRAQYQLQTGHPLNLALAKEVPALGSVVSYEMSKQRKPSDSLPAFISMNAITSQAGLVNQGFLSAEYGPMNLAIVDGPPKLSPPSGAEETFARRWRLLQEFDGELRGGASGRGRNLADYHEYYRSAHAMMSDARVPGIFKIEDIACTIYSALGINWTKIVKNTPSGRAFHYVEPASGTTYVDFQPVNELFA